ncbi:hypothetical protein HPB52_007718 [Rhipicephalus sanguineus]|uniref:Uncharacterized protein n=1 Tax=Rhipicephalus sanguineus TaxID=34632 RepID=A0A9D4T7E9_RHISA|nr:hypothetical protein HPB52_007718 [Rhipicephalus sanguineus]
MQVAEQSMSPSPKGKAEEELEELAESLQLPSEVLALREGSDEVWCNLTRDIAADTELLAHFTASPQNKQMLPSTESAADADTLVDDIDVVVDDTDNVESTSSAAEELKNGVRSRLKTVSSSPVPTPCNGPDVPVAADDETKAPDGTENHSAHAEKAESPK